jgi:hypothetical protein
MAIVNTTLLDIARANGSDAIAGLIDEAQRPHPEIVYLPARTIKGINYKTLVRTAVPRGGSFRQANQGANVVKGSYENRLVETFIFNPRWECDKAVADRYEDGAEAYIALEAGAMMEGAMADLCAQFYYGGTTQAAINTTQESTLASANAFPGLVTLVDTNKVVDAGGSTAKSSVWLIRIGPRMITWVMGNQGGFNMDNPRIETLWSQSGGANTINRMTGYVQEMLSYPGLQVGSIHSCARIQVYSDAGCGLTPDLINQAIAAFPEGTAPDLILGNNRSWQQWQSSLTAVNVTGAPAPFPKQHPGPFGDIPFHPTAAIVNGETV